MTEDRRMVARFHVSDFVLGAALVLSLWIMFEIVARATADDVLGCPHGVERQWQCEAETSHRAETP